MDNPPAWARLVLRNLAIGRWRRRASRLSNVPLTEGSSVTLPPNAEHLDLVRALYHLPEQQRTVLILHDVVGLSVAETATEIGAPEGSVRGWLSKGRRSLGTALGLEKTGKKDGDEMGAR
jgi:RNA polymerase sigma-70 factor (ECF subfamily)